MTLPQIYSLIFDIGGSDKEFVLCRDLELGQELHNLNNNLFTFEPETQRLWRTNVWRDSAETYFKQKAKADAQRHILNLRDEAVSILVKNLMNKTGLDRDTLKPLCYKLLSGKDVSKLKQFGIDLDKEDWRELK